MATKNIVVIGAGVAGLTTALLLSRNSRYRVVVAAKHMPGDYDIEYASPWAGANYFPVSIRGTELAEWDRQTWPVLESLARSHPEAGVHFQEAETWTRSKDSGAATAAYSSESLSSNPWYNDVVPNFRSIDQSELPEGIAAGTSFVSVCINTAIYLPYLVGQCLKNGVVFNRAIFQHILDSTKVGVHPAGQVDLVVNCTGLMACKLGGVEDSDVYPVRGQIVIVRNGAGGKMINVSGTDDGEQEACYWMERAAGGGTVIGGTYDIGNWESVPDPNVAVRMMTRAVEADPALADGKGVAGLDIVRHAVGLRPERQGGTRVEREQIDGVWIVHNYGAGAAGYQSSYGCAMAVVRLTDEALELKQGGLPGDGTPVEDRKLEETVW